MNILQYTEKRRRKEKEKAAATDDFISQRQRPTALKIHNIFNTKCTIYIHTLSFNLWLFFSLSSSLS